MKKAEREYDLYKKETTKLIIYNFNNNKKLDLTDTEKKSIFRILEKRISEASYNLSLNYLILGLLYDRENTLDHIKRKGLFRYSKYIGNKCIIHNLCVDIILLSSDLCLDTNIIEYLNSIIHLSPLHSILQTIRLEIIKAIRAFNKNRSHNNKSFIKTLIVFLEHLFFSLYSPRQKDYPNDLYFYTKEMISEAISFIFYLYNEIFGFTDRDLGLLDEDYILSNKVQDIILNACLFKKLQEFEIYVDHFSYRCIMDNKHLRIIPPCPEIEKSIRLGYIRTESQRFNEIEDYASGVSIEEICDRLMSYRNMEILKYTESNAYPRYRIEIPESIISIINERFFSPNNIFKEEEELLFHSIKEQIISLKEIQNLKLKGNLLLIDFLKIKRFFTLLYLIFFKGLFKDNIIDTKIILRSLIPEFSKQTIHKYLDQIVTPDKVDSFLDLVTWKPEQHTLLDLQYQSFINLGNYYLVPVSLFVNSNTIRNIYSLEYKLNNPDIFDDGRCDHLADLLSDVFENKGFRTFKRISHDFGKGGDIDFLAVNDNLIFVAECKKSLLPTDIYELRTLFDNLWKASEQLDLITEALTKKENRYNIGMKIGYDISKERILIASIIATNRIFVGLRLFKYPIRNIQEVLNIIGTGIIKTKKGEYSVWKNNEFSLDDLIYYFEDEKFHQYLFEAMNEKHILYRFKSINIQFDTYALDINKAENNREILNYQKK